MHLPCRDGSTNPFQILAGAFAATNDRHLTQALPWKVVWITGASTGIGREIALQLAARGVTVAASARSADKLAILGINTKPYPLDVTDRPAVLATIAAIERDLGPIDLAILAAGTYCPVDVENFDPIIFETAITANYLGVVNALAGLLPRMMSRRSGHVAWIASVAGYVGLPKAAAYGPSKAALINLAESLKPDLDVHGVTVSVINPGFVETPLTAQNDFNMPFLIQTPEAARLSIEGLLRHRFEIAYPWRFVFIMKVARLLPYGLFFRLIRGMVIK
jgi:NAD(P)-dependent dehydrogenase (short-subunit alcohol dehydrogenase family)